MPELAVVGLGPAGCIFLACLPPEKLSPEIFAYEAACVGGDLSRLYGDVVANLTCAEMRSAMQKVPAWRDQKFSFLEKYRDEECPPLSEICKQMRQLIQPILKKITLRMCCVQKIQQTTGGWNVFSDSEGAEPEEFYRVVLCTGASPKQLNFPKSVIPLEVALSPDRLKKFVDPADAVVVFGTSHSGTLALRNLRDAGCTKLTAVYGGKAPFVWARDGDPDGLKQDSAAVADAIVSGVWGSATPALVQLSECDRLFNRTCEAIHMVYAIGFRCRAPPVFGLDGREINMSGYDAATGIIAPGLWGFGIGFPSFYTKPSGAKSVDVGFGPFADHILSCLAPFG